MLPKTENCLLGKELMMRNNKIDKNMATKFTYIFTKQMGIIKLNDCNVFFSIIEKLEIIASTVVRVTPLLCSCKFN